MHYETSAAKNTSETDPNQSNQSVTSLPAPFLATSSQSPAQRALFDRSTDFWLMGGASCLVWLAMATFASFRGQYAFGHHYQNVIGFSGLMVLFINYPHFMLSYKIAYSRGARFILAHWFQLLFIPISLMALTAFAYFTFNDPTPLLPEFNPSRVAVGEGVLALMVSFMYLTVGWHYVKQTFGCMMVYSSFDRYKLSLGQRRTLLGLLYVVWFGSLVGSNVGPSVRSDFYGLQILSWGLPLWLRAALDCLFWLAFGLFAFTGPFQIWRKTGQKPSLNFLIPLIALTVWWNPLFYQRDFYFLLVPLFHSLQYLPFAAKYEQNRMRDRNPHWLRGRTLTILALIAAGFLSFELLPGLGRDFSSSVGPNRVIFFMVAAHVFINVHHYFIDNVIWRFHHPEVQKYLLGRV